MGRSHLGLSLNSTYFTFGSPIGVFERWKMPRNGLVSGAFGGVALDLICLRSAVSSYRYTEVTSESAIT
jgi:hypothetical protein